MAQHVEFQDKHLLSSPAVKGVDPNLVIQIAAQLLPIVLQYGMPLVEKIITAIKEDPNLPADEENLKKTVLDRLDEASKLDQQVLAEE